ncbi:MAG: hypothetical protein K2Z80_05715 [Xanthobacteraceae bacterium]|nr:hypothetical protein [Xanthobacteraceae bacterium]
MHRTLLFAAAALSLLSVPADARDGCGRGWFYNGRACVQMDDDEGPRYAPRYRGGYGYGHGYEGGYRYGGGHRDPGSYRAPNFGGDTVRPVRGNNGAISCSNRNYTWQDGACRPYRGP